MRYYFEIANKNTNEVREFLGNSFAEVIEKHGFMKSDWVILHQEDLNDH